MTSAFLALLLVLAQAVAPQSGSPSEDTAQIRGRVTDRDTGRPLPGAQVILAERTQNLNRTATTDDAGVFRFTRLPPGKYDGIVTAGSYRSSHGMEELVASRPRSIDLAKGAVREINVALSRTPAIPVRVVDEFGDPLSDVTLSIYRAPAMDIAAVPINHRTDDRGRMRVPELAPGRYVLCADTFGAGGTPTIKNPLRERLLRTCYPSAANEADAEPVVVGTGPVGEIEIRMRRGRTFTISGIVLDASGAPAAGAQVDLSVFRAGSSGSSGGPRLGQDGRFRIDHVRPGAYGLQASIGGPDRPEDRRARETAFIPIRVSDSDAEDLVVTLSKGVDVPGTIVLEDPAQPLPQPQGSAFMVTARLAGDFLSGTGSGIYAYARTDRTFTLAGVFGRRTLSFLNVPVGWYVKQVRYRGDEVIDKAIDYARGEGTASLEVVLSNRGATITGRVIDDLARPVRAFVWLLRADGDTVTEPAAEAATSANGEFRLGPLREGEYVAVAFASRVRPLERDDRVRAAKLATLGERVRLTELDERTIELRVIREEPR
jgi:protocatechuate 3,4-dioxygenase beta subunit